MLLMLIATDSYSSCLTLMMLMLLLCHRNQIKKKKKKEAEDHENVDSWTKPKSVETLDLHSVFMRRSAFNRVTAPLILK